MPSREERFYEKAYSEVENNQASQAIWAKAFSLAAGEETKAKALYIKLRVEQLERDYQQSIPEIVQEAWARVKAGKQFVCPYCETCTTAVCEDVDFAIQLFKGIPRYRYYCPACKTALRPDALPKPETGSRPSEDKRNNPMALTGFILSLLGVPLYFIGIIPLLGVVFSLIGLGTFKDETQTNKWMAIVGVILGAFFSLMGFAFWGRGGQW